MQKAGKYEILRKIGTGGFGVVYEGRDPFIKRRVAIKTCTSEDEEIRQRFFREAEIAGNLEQRNIVTIFDFGFEDGVPYLVQEYLAGEDLDHKITRKDPLTTAQKLELLLQVAQGLAYAHSRGVIHRDIKPGNIRVLEDGRVKIMDFGIARLADVESGLTKAGMTIGTAAYLPPEQIRGDKVDARADIFSFGVVAYELLAYQRPFDGKTLSTLLYQILSQEPLPLGELWFDAPPRLAKLVMRCLEKDSSDRPASFDAVVGELAAVASETAGIDETLRIPQSAVPAAPAETEAEGLGPFAERARAALAAGDMSAAELEITLAAKKFGEGPTFRRLLEPLRRELAAIRDRHEEERRRGDRLRSLLERARKLVAQQSFDEARLALQAALEIDPGHGEARALIDQAESELAEAAREKARAEDLQARRKALEKLLDGDQLDRAREALAGAQAEHGESALADLERRLESSARAQQIAALAGKARSLLAAGDLEEAAEMGRRALAIDPQAAAAREVVAAAESRIAERAAETERQRVAAERARQEDRQRRRQAVEQSLGRGDFDGARRALAEAISVHGAVDTFAALHDRLLVAERAAQVASLVREAEAKLHDDEAELAIEYARRALEIDAGSRDARDVLERAQAEQRRLAAEAERSRRIAAAAEEISAQLERHGPDKAQRALQRFERELGDEPFAALRERIVAARAATDAERVRGEQAQRERNEAEELAREKERQRLAEERRQQAAARESERQRAVEEARRQTAEREAEKLRQQEEKERQTAAREAERQRLAEEKEAERQRVAVEREASREREAAAAKGRAKERAQEDIAAFIEAGKLDKAERALDRALEAHGEYGELSTLRGRLDGARSSEREAAERTAAERADLSRARALEAAAGTEVPSGSFAVPGGGRPNAARWALAAGGALALVGVLVWVLMRGGDPSPPVTTTTSQPQGTVAPPVSSSPPPPAVSRPEPERVAEEPPLAESQPPQPEPADVPATVAPLTSPAAGLVAQGRERWRAGDREGALRAYSDARQRDPQAIAAVQGLSQIERDAKRQLAAAKQSAVGARAESLAPNEFRAAESEAARTSGVRDPAQAARSAWQAADLYSKAQRSAEQRARELAAVPPPVAEVAPPPVEPAPPQVTPPAVTEAPPAAAIDESEGVRAALRRYETAYESLDVGAVRGAWPSLSDSDSRALARAFAGYDRLQMGLEGCRIQVEGANATATCRVSQTIDVKVGSDLSSNQQITFRLRKTGDAWTIAGRSVQ